MQKKKPKLLSMCLAYLRLYYSTKIQPSVQARWTIHCQDVWAGTAEEIKFIHFSNKITQAEYQKKLAGKGSNNEDQWDGDKEANDDNKGTGQSRSTTPSTCQEHKSKAKMYQEYVASLSYVAI